MKAARTIEELARDPCPESWRLLCVALTELAEPEALARIEAIEADLDAWPEELRATMCGMDWDDRFWAGNPDPRSRIVRFLRFDRLFFGRYGGMRIREPNLGEAQMRGLASSRGVGALTRMDFSYHPLGSKGVGALARGRHFTALRQLNLGSCDLDRAALAALAKAPFFGQLHELRIHDNRLSGDALGPLVDDAPTLRRLDVSNNPIGPDGAAVLAGAHLPALSDLEIRSCELGAEGARALAGRVGPILEKLVVSSNGLGDEGLAALVSGSLRARGLTLSTDAVSASGLHALFAAGWPLTSLTLSNNALGDEAAREIAALAPQTLASLDLEDNDIGGAGLAILLGSDRLALRSLDLTGNRIGGAAVAMLGTTMRTIESLDLGENRLEDEGVARLSAAEAEALRSLSLVRNGITARALEALTGAPWFGGLTSLDLSHNPLGAAAGLVLGSRMLASLTLTACGLGDQGALALAAAEFRPTYLNLDACDLTDAGLEALAGSPVLSNVEKLVLSRNRLGDRGIRALVRSANAPRLKELHLDGNRVGDEGALALASWEGPLAFHVDGNPIDGRGKEALDALPARCCP